jgi:16S rRNA (adenine1518-N6/adenine1519-N6)-dimethyltransferase
MLLSGFRPRKNKGQNFLTDKNIVRKILGSISLTNESVVLEIGPGYGILTERLASCAEKILAVELDKNLFGYLRDSLKTYTNIELINSDILKFNIAEFIRTNSIKRKITLVGNIPYNITTPILEYVFENMDLFNSAYLMVQKEVALRLKAKPNTKDYSSLSCFAQFHSNLSVLFQVKRTCFKPVPKVDSCFIKIEPKRMDSELGSLVPKDKALLFRIIRTAFGKRRKNILNSLSTILEKKKLESVLSKLRISHNSRAENLSVQDFIRISNICFAYFNYSHIIE